MEKCNIDNENNSIEVVGFLLNNDKNKEKYAIEVLYVEEVCFFKSITKLPCTPAFIIGIMNFRGKIISVIDIRNFLEFTSKSIDCKDVKNIIVVKLNDIEFGIAADFILGCTKISMLEIQKDILHIENTKKHYFRGITREKNIILNIKNIILDKEIIIDEENFQ
ncbi:chemotaxis protein CheW [Clostridium scatologenes]|uniref:CheW protein n=1 Tax=Clostridium scatologenes TaxID=1548 RepID=A0A0E3GQD1_CLOSL|nr:chemotaxis protein CheW [Clostridium scatologenes]AKA68361.1 CheW protein [Clostridium scatologenes]